MKLRRETYFLKMIIYSRHSVFSFYYFSESSSHINFLIVYLQPVSCWQNNVITSHEPIFADAVLSEHSIQVEQEERNVARSSGFVRFLHHLHVSAIREFVKIPERFKECLFCVFIVNRSHRDIWPRVIGTSAFVIQAFLILSCRAALRKNEGMDPECSSLIALIAQLSITYHFLSLSHFQLSYFDKLIVPQFYFTLLWFS